MKIIVLLTVLTVACCQTTNPTTPPTASPSTHPTYTPTTSPTQHPSNIPTPAPSLSPTPLPSMSPTHTPTRSPTSKINKNDISVPLLSGLLVAAIIVIAITYSFSKTYADMFKYTPLVKIR